MGFIKGCRPVTPPSYEALLFFSKPENWLLQECLELQTPLKTPNNGIPVR
jgi:hypothetical protein